MSASAASPLEKLLSGAFYALCSILVIFLNKIILSEYGFSDFMFVSLSQFVSTVLVLLLLHALRRVEIQPLTLPMFIEISPVAALFMGNVVSGLGGTRSLNLPMFTALRRFSIMMTMLGEYAVLNKEPSLPVLLSVAGMVFGALVAALYDLAFDAYGYALVFTNNVFTALSGVYLKKASGSAACSKTAVLFYNSLLSGLALCAFYMVEHLYQVSVSQTGAQAVMRGGLPAPSAMFASTALQVWQHPAWKDPEFVRLFVFSAFMGSALNYSIFLCTTCNSALTTAVIGCMKNVVTTYVGMIFLSGYTFNMLNFVGINISVAASFYYTYVALK